MLIILHAEWHARLSNFSSMLGKGVIQEKTINKDMSRTGFN